MAVGVKILLTLLFTATPALARKHTRDPRAIATDPASLRLQNEEADRDRLPRIKNKSALRELIGDGELVPFPSSPSLRVHIPRERAFARPWVVTFVTTVADDFYRVFGKPLQVNSAVRTLDEQRRLRRWNRNAAPLSGPNASVHPTGLAVDLQRRGLSPVELRWLRIRLLLASARQEAIIEEELRQPCFHVVVRKSAYEVLPILAQPPVIELEVTSETLTGEPGSAIVGPMKNIPNNPNATARDFFEPLDDAKEALNDLAMMEDEADLRSKGFEFVPALGGFTPKADRTGEDDIERDKR